MACRNGLHFRIKFTRFEVYSVLLSFFLEIDVKIDEIDGLITITVYASNQVY